MLEFWYLISHNEKGVEMGIVASGLVKENGRRAGVDGWEDTEDGKTNLVLGLANVDGL